MFDLRDKVAVITGGSSGIGAAAARRFCAAGAIVVIASRSDASEFAHSIGAISIRADVAIEAEIAALMQNVGERYGRIDILINNAGVFPPPGNIAEISADDMIAAFTVNALGPMLGIKHASPLLSDGAVVINTTSLAGLEALAGYGAYVASKFAANGVTLCAALELGARNIRVNAICPPSVNTPMLTNQPGAADEIAITRTASALNRVIEPEDVAALMHFLASADCASFTGQLIRLDAGMGAGISPAMLGALLKGIA